MAKHSVLRRKPFPSSLGATASPWHPGPGRSGDGARERLQRRAPASLSPVPWDEAQHTTIPLLWDPRLALRRQFSELVCPVLPGHSRPGRPEEGGVGRQEGVELPTLRPTDAWAETPTHAIAPSPSACRRNWVHGWADFCASEFEPPSPVRVRGREGRGGEPPRAAG